MNRKKESPSQRVAREDLVLFINGCFACTGQSEFYGEAGAQELSLEFLHAYILGNYRSLYARCLVAGINHYNQQQIVIHLLSTGADTPPGFREHEGQLIRRALWSLPVHRVLQVFETLRARRINNRRVRAIIRSYVQQRPDIAFDAIKYRRKLRASARHAHLRLPSEVGDFVFRGHKGRRFSTPLLETYRQAHFDKEAVFRLPYTVAEGLAAKLRIPRDRFLSGIDAQLTQTERLRLQTTSRPARTKMELGTAPLTKLALYVLSLARSQREADSERLIGALQRAAERAFRRAPYPLGKVAAVLDRSYSSSGSSEKLRRPLGVALATSALLRASAPEYRAYWTPRLSPSKAEASPSEELLVFSHGQTDLATPFLDALSWEPDVVLIVSDGFENSPPGVIAQLAQAYQRHIDRKKRTTIVHLNPVFDAENYSPRSLGAPIPTLGLRDAEDLLTMLGFARFAAGQAPLDELLGYLAARERQKTYEEQR